MQPSHIEAHDLMLATPVRAPFSRADWLFELNYDGYRCLVRKAGARVDLIARRGNLLNRSFPEIVAAIERLPGNFIWDAELRVDEPTGQSSLGHLQIRARTSAAARVRAAAKLHPARLYVFDMLAVGARDIRSFPLTERKHALRDSFDNTSSLVCVSGVVTAGTWVFEQAQAQDLAGMVAKRLSSPYQRGRSLDWLKIKNSDYRRPVAQGWSGANTTMQAMGG